MTHLAVDGGNDGVRVTDGDRVTDGGDDEVDDDEVDGDCLCMLSSLSIIFFFGLGTDAFFEYNGWLC